MQRLLLHLADSEVVTARTHWQDNCVEEPALVRVSLRPGQHLFDRCHDRHDRSHGSSEFKQLGDIGIRDLHDPVHYPGCEGRVL